MRAASIHPRSTRVRRASHRRHHPHAINRNSLHLRPPRIRAHPSISPARSVEIHSHRIASFRRVRTRVLVRVHVLDVTALRGEARLAVTVRRGAQEGVVLLGQLPDQIAGRFDVGNHLLFGWLVWDASTRVLASRKEDRVRG
jgi:hypothetical protein